MKKQNLKRGVVLVAVLFLATVLVPFSSEAASKNGISKKNASICVGEKLTLKVNGKTKVKWKTSNKKIASVNKNGVITGKKKGSCTITATSSGKKYNCKVKVKKLPENYATVNGKKVKVGKTVKLIYSIQAEKPISTLGIKYKYNHDALEIVNLFDEKRYPNWVLNEYWPECSDDDNKSVYDLVHLVGLDEKKPYDFTDISCKKAKVVDCMKVKVLKSGNYTMNVNIYYANGNDYQQKVKYKVIEKIK